MRAQALFAGLALAATALEAEPHAGLKKRVAEQDLGASDRANKEVAITGGDVIGAQALIHCAVTEYAYTQSGGSR